MSLTDLMDAIPASAARPEGCRDADAAPVRPPRTGGLRGCGTWQNPAVVHREEAWGSVRPQPEFLRVRSYGSGSDADAPTAQP